MGDRSSATVMKTQTQASLVGVSFSLPLGHLVCPCLFVGSVGPALCPADVDVFLCDVCCFCCFLLAVRWTAR